MTNNIDLLKYFKNKSLIEIKSKNIDEIKKFFEENNINIETSESSNNFYEILEYLIDVSSSTELIEFIIGLLSNWKKYNYFYLAVIEEKFKLADVLLKNVDYLSERYNNHRYVIFEFDESCYGSDKYYSIQYYRVIHGLMKNNCLTKRNLQYLLNHGYPKIIDTYIFCELIRRGENEILEYILNYQPEDEEYLKNNILNKFLIGCYKNKLPLTDEQILKILYQRINNNTTNEDMVYSVDKIYMDCCRQCGTPCECSDHTRYTPLAVAYCCDNMEAVDLLLDYGEIHNINYYTDDFYRSVEDISNPYYDYEVQEEDEEDLDLEIKYFYNDDFLMDHDQFRDYGLIINTKNRKHNTTNYCRENYYACGRSGVEPEALYILREIYLLIEIKSKNIDEIKNFFEENNINIETSESSNDNDFYEILEYLIDVSSSTELIKFIIGLLYNWKKYHYFYLAVKNENFKLADVLLKNVDFLSERYYNPNYVIYKFDESFYGSDKYYSIQYYRVIHGLMKNSCLTKRNLQYLLNHGYPKIIDTYIFCELIRRGENEILEYILNYQPEEYLKNNILNKFLIGCYKNKLSLTDEQILKILYQRINNNTTKEDMVYSVDKFYMNCCIPCDCGMPCECSDPTHYTPLAVAYCCDNVEAVDLLLDYGEIHNINYYTDDFYRSVKGMNNTIYRSVKGMNNTIYRSVKGMNNTIYRSVKGMNNTIYRSVKRMNNTRYDYKVQEEDEDDLDLEIKYFYNDDFLMDHDQFRDYGLIINTKNRKHKSNIKSKTTTYYGENYYDCGRNGVEPEALYILREIYLLIEIKSKNIDEIKKFFEDNNINTKTSGSSNDFYEILEYLINVSSSTELIKFIIGLLSNWKKYNYFYLAVKNENFKLADVLLKNVDFLSERYDNHDYIIYKFDESCKGSDKYYSIQYYQVIHGLMKNNCLTKRNLQYLLNHGYPKIIDTYIFCELIRRGENEILEYILNYQPEECLKNNILNKFLIGCYKNKLPLTDEQILKILYQGIKNYTTNEDMVYSVDKIYVHCCRQCGIPCECSDPTRYTPLAVAYYYDNIEAVDLLLDYGEIHNINYYTNDFYRSVEDISNPYYDYEVQEEDEEDLDLEIKYFFNDDFLMDHDQFRDYGLIINTKNRKHKSNIKSKSKYNKSKLIKNKNKIKYHNKAYNKLETYLI
ncbi:hypothetical protein BCR32DRAFT_292735 [Anaeromyces robustus]|uniref:Ankyrin n=1 Tax=Anaeromyces robustus TaxID=1754192 RepID=A0A1Y1X990_9FUNG|nr:hypothetical protein BCR32DRAFT_292735 [Anaeromyces robustus]|eukprot:ORX82288.1 hypothetical protein BCR32DRAFT_292735 [Anaeromyces robustus]